MNRAESDAQSLPPRGEPIDGEFFRAIADCTYDWESWHSDKGELLWVNPAVERFTGYTVDECLAMDDYPLCLIDASDLPRMTRYIQEMAGGSRGNNIEFKVRHRDGSHRWVAVSWQPMTDEHGHPLGFRTSVRDVADKRTLREQLRLHNEHLEQLVQERTARVAELEKHRAKMQHLAALGQLAAGVAHEINNPLAGIRNALLLIKRQLKADTKHFDKFDLIDREIDRISGITHQMYQLYRPSQQTPARFSVQQTVQEAISLVTPHSRKRKVAVIVAFDVLKAVGELGPGEVMLREGELKQVLLNLIHNAVQASKPGQRVRVEVGTDERSLSIAVVDQGHGVRPEHLSKIFDPFFSTKTETVGQGMGLGLSVSRGIIEAMKGTLEVESEVAKGSRFVVKLPRRLDGNP